MVNINVQKMNSLKMQLFMLNAFFLWHKRGLNMQPICYMPYCMFLFGDLLFACICFSPFFRGALSTSQGFGLCRVHSAASAALIKPGTSFFWNPMCLRGKKKRQLPKSAVRCRVRRRKPHADWNINGLLWVLSQPSRRNGQKNSIVDL